MTATRFTAAVVQVAPAFLDLDAGIARAEELIAEADDRGASVVAFPET